MSRFHEEQHFHGAILAVLIAALVVVAIVSVVELVAGRPAQLWLVVIGPLVVGVVAVLLSLSHLDVDVTDEGVTIAFRYVWPARRIAFSEVVGLEVRRYDPASRIRRLGRAPGSEGLGLHDERRRGRAAAAAQRTPHFDRIDAAAGARGGYTRGCRGCPSDVTRLAPTATTAGSGTIAS